MKSFKRLLSDWLIHSALLWLVINITTLIPFVYRTVTEGAYLYYADGSPVTGWQYFLNHNFYQADMLVIPVFILLTELNYRYLLKSKRFRLPVVGLMCLLAGALSLLLLALLSPERFAITGIAAAIEPVLFTAGYGLGYLLIRDYFVQLRHKKELKERQTESELKALKTQLHPHFLFNSLNYLYGTALQEGALRTSDGIDQLSEMLRYVLSGIDENFVPLSSELKFVDNFIALQQVRLRQTGIIQANIENAAPAELKIAPLLLLPFIDNAFKYGISVDRPEPVHLKIEVTGNCLHLETSNQVLPHTNEISGSGTCIVNTRKRLELLYPGKHKLECRTHGRTYHVSLILELS